MNKIYENIHENINRNITKDLSPENIVSGLNILDKQIPNKQKVINDIEKGLNQINNMIDKLPEGDIHIHGDLTLTFNPKNRYTAE